MNGYQCYIAFSAIKEFIDELAYAYKDDIKDEPLHLYMAHLEEMDMTNEKPIRKVINSFELYFKDKQNHIMIYEPEVSYCDLDFYLKKDDENTHTIERYLNAIKNIFVSIENNIISSEETFLNDFVSKFKNSIGMKEMIKPSSSKEETQRIITDQIEHFKPNIEKSVDEFQSKNLSIDRIIKLLSIKLKDFLQKNDIPAVAAKSVDKQHLIEILDIAIKYDHVQLIEHKFEIIGLLSKSGMLAHLPLGTLLSSFSENTMQPLDT